MESVVDGLGDMVVGLCYPSGGRNRAYIPTGIKMFVRCGVRVQ